MRVRVYRNLKHGRSATPLYSVQRLGKNRHVIDHVGRIFLTNARFIVSEAGRQRVIREQRKNVHAYVEGEWKADDERKHELSLAKRVHYNPYTMFYFQTLEGERVDKAKFVLLNEGGITIERRS